MHSKRYDKEGSEMGSYVLDNTLSPLGICLGLQYFISLGVHGRGMTWIPKRYGYDNAPKRYVKCNPRDMDIGLG